MRDPQPVQVLVMVVFIGAGFLALWWMGLPAAVRDRVLTQIVMEERVQMLPPPGMWDQAEWLYTHRASWLLGQAAVFGLVFVIGMCEGMARRRSDVYGGWLHRWWTVGVMALASGALAVGCCLILPWSLVRLPVVPLLAGLGGLAGYGLGAGRPTIG